MGFDIPRAVVKSVVIGIVGTGTDGQQDSGTHTKHVIDQFGKPITNLYADITHPFKNFGLPLTMQF